MATVRGTVKSVWSTNSSNDGVPCLNAYVTLQLRWVGTTYETYTDAAGEYVFNDIPIGYYFLVATWDDGAYSYARTIVIDIQTASEVVIHDNVVLPSRVHLYRSEGGTTDPESTLYPNYAWWFPSYSKQFYVTVKADPGYSARYYIVDDGNPIPLDPNLPSQTVLLDASVHRNVDFVFSPVGVLVGVLQGVVIDVTSGWSINGATVTLDNGDSTTTDWSRELSYNQEKWVVGFYKFLAVPVGGDQ